MIKKLRPVLLILIVGFILLLLEILLLNHPPAIFTPQGIIAQKERDFIVLAVLLMSIVLIPLVLTAYFFAWKYRDGNRNSRYEPNKEHSLPYGFLWALIPTGVVIALMVIVWQGAHTLDPYRPIEKPGVKPLTIQVVSLDWKWLFIYPEQHIATVNFVEFPAQTPLNFELTSDEAPMNSFWIPQLGGQIYTMTGMSTQLHLMADKAGEYRGSSAEIDGRGFAGMRFMAKSVSSTEFSSWVESVKKSTPSLTPEEYNRLTQPSENNPVALYSSVQDNLYNEIMMKYMDPEMVH